MTHPEIEREQAHIDHAYARLEVMIADSKRWAADHAANRQAAGPRRDALVESSLRRAAQLDVGDEPLVFGRTDGTDGERLHIGRVGVYDEDHDPLVTDWRAPASEAFYRATATEPLGLVRRRHIVCRGRKVTRLDDELLGSPDGEQAGIELVGEGALLDALRRARTGRMRDIVATIQAEQDAVIRAPLEGVLVVQGGPGTGKTAVALHRAAYLLYAERERLSRSGVLVVGPNPIFLRYISEVLPSLGETAELATVTELVDGLDVEATEPTEVARIKGDARMVKVIARAVSALPQPLTADVRIPYEDKHVTLTKRASVRIVQLAQQRLKGKHNLRYGDVVGFVRTYLWNRWKGSERDWVEATGKEGRRHFEATVVAEPAFLEAMATLWPRISAPGLVARLLSSPEVLEQAAAGVLTEGEQAMLARPASDGFTEADAGLVDEAAAHLGPVRRARKRADGDILEGDEAMIDRMLDDLAEVDPLIASQRAMLAERYRGARRDLERDDRDRSRARPTHFGYVIVDEAQGLSPMQWRMIARRCTSGNMTVLGDLGQTPAGIEPGTWQEALAALGRKRARVHELTVNYRTPTEIMEIAARVLEHAAPTATAPRSVRSVGRGPVFDRVEPSELVDAVARHVVSEREQLADGKLAILATQGTVDELAGRLGVRTVDVARALDEPVVALTVDAARGLEFDGVIVVEPSAIAGAEGLRALYVALTRSTQRLVVVHSGALPAPLEP